MSAEGAIAISHLWKRFRPDTGGSLAKYELQKWNERLGRGKVQWVWALRDVDFEIEPGEAVGLIGNNGSGKSTLLKIINQVMFPYAGSVAVGGRIGALIEVRAGIQPELSGRENIFLYGALLGFSKAEMARRFDEIVEWAELAFAIDRQVKYYSSGMSMRLGFAVAVFLDPAVLLVDEVLSVGDARFQQRCLDRMAEVTDNGTTLLFVSHDLAAVGAACKRGVWLHQGVVQADGSIGDILGAYRRSVERAAAAAQLQQGKVRVLSASIEHPEMATPMTQEPVEVRLLVESQHTGSASVYLGVSEGTSDPIFVFRQYITFDEDTRDLRCRIPRLPLPKGHYFLWFGVIDHKVNPNEDLFVWSPVARFDVYGPGLDDPPDAVVRRAPVHVEYSWETSAADRNEALDAAIEYVPPSLPGQ
jgi:ABC-type polysaccharide/polyol phosphate transport system ATPase subunit